MRQTLAVGLSMLLVCFFMTGCTDNQAEKEAVKAVLQNNLKALQEEDLDGYLATLHKESPGYEKMKKVCPKIFEIYDLEHEIREIKVLDLSDQKAKVRTVQTARRLAGPPSYKDNQSTTVHTLKKYQGEWKVYQTTQKSMKYLNDTAS